MSDLRETRKQWNGSMRNLDTRRLRCEPLSVRHAKSMCEVLSEPETYRYIPGEPPRSVAELRTRYEFLTEDRGRSAGEEWFNWIVYEKTSGAPIGHIQATLRPRAASIAYIIQPRSCGFGYATEACVAMIDYLFNEKKLSEIQAEIDPRNYPSIRVMEKLIGSEQTRDAESGDVIMTINASDWREWRRGQGKGLHE